jgi:hypothetical protein
MIYTHSILGQQGFSAETRGIVRDRQRRQRQVSRLHRLGPGALERFIEAIEDGADISSALSSHANESRSFLDSLRQTLPYARQIDEDGTAWLFNRFYDAIWRKRPNGPPEPASGKCWARWGTQHWFFTDRTHPFRRSPESRALRQALEAVLREFHGGDHDGPVARRLIKETEKERARARQIWDARIAKRDRTGAAMRRSRPEVMGGGNDAS